MSCTLSRLEGFQLTAVVGQRPRGGKAAVALAIARRSRNRRVANFFLVFHTSSAMLRHAGGHPLSFRALSPRIPAAGWDTLLAHLVLQASGATEPSPVTSSKLDSYACRNRPFCFRARSRICASRFHFIGK